MKPIIRFEQTVLGYRLGGKTVPAVGPVDLSIAEGEAFGLIGESGAGKSTLGLEALGLLKYRGGVPVSGRTWKAFEAHEAAYIPQDPLSALDPLFSIGSQLAETGASTAQIREAMDRVHLPMERISLKSYPHELSGGMRQRIVIAMALLKRPRLLVADEPTSSLDVILQAEIMSLFSEIHHSGVTFIFITHHLPLAAGFCGRLGVMKAGKIVETGDTSEVINRPAGDYTRLLIESIPELPQ